MVIIIIIISGGGGLVARVPFSAWSTTTQHTHTPWPAGWGSGQGCTHHRYGASPPHDTGTPGGGGGTCCTPRSPSRRIHFVLAPRTHRAQKPLTMKHSTRGSIRIHGRAHHHTPRCLSDNWRRRNLGRSGSGRQPLVSPVRAAHWLATHQHVFWFWKRL